MSFSVPSSGRRGLRVPPVPGPAPGCHRGLALVAPPGWVTMRGDEGPRDWSEAPPEFRVQRVAPAAPDLGEAESPESSAGGPGGFGEVLQGCAGMLGALSGLWRSLRSQCIQGVIQGSLGVSGMHEAPRGTKRFQGYSGALRTPQSLLPPFLCSPQETAGRVSGGLQA